MARLKPKATTKEDFLDYLSGYSDFSFELSVLKTLVEHDVLCNHGGCYIDPVTNKSREFDIRATKTIDKYRVRMSIECKNTRDNFPILVSCVPRREEESYHQVALVSDRNTSIRHFAPSAPRSRALILPIRGAQSLYKSGGAVGKSTVQVGRALDGSITTNDSDLYEKWGQSLSSLHDMTRDIHQDGGLGDPLDAYASTAFPFVVVPDGRLWMTSYDLNGLRISDPTQVDRCSCFIGKRYWLGNETDRASLLISHLEIITLKGLSAFVEAHLMSIEGIERIFPQDGLKDALERKLR